MTDFRALCKELVDELHACKVAHPNHDTDVITRARAVLAEQPVEPTDGDLDEPWYSKTGSIWYQIEAFRARQQGADQELEACCKWLGPLGIKGGDNLRRARRPKPPSLKEQAIKDLDDLEANLKDFGMGFVPITNLRKALEALPND